jgi:hypothetical protein
MLKSDGGCYGSAGFAGGAWADGDGFAHGAKDGAPLWSWQAFAVWLLAKLVVCEQLDFTCAILIRFEVVAIVVFVGELHLAEFAKELDGVGGLVEVVENECPVIEADDRLDVLLGQGG